MLGKDNVSLHGVHILLVRDQKWSKEKRYIFVLLCCVVWVELFFNFDGKEL